MQTKRLIGLSMAMFLAAACVSRAAIITQEFSTGQIEPGSNTEHTFNVNRFDASLGTLTRVTFSISLESWGGYYTVENITNPQAVVQGILYQGIDAYLTGGNVPAGLPSTLFAGTTKNYTLPAPGDKDGINGPSYDNRNQVGPASTDASSADFNSYLGVGTYAVVFHSSQGYHHTADGAVQGGFQAASSQGYLTVTYEYEAVPEPATLGLLVLGVAALAVRRRVPRSKS